MFKPEKTSGWKALRPKSETEFPASPGQTALAITIELRQGLAMDTPAPCPVVSDDHACLALLSVAIRAGRVDLQLDPIMLSHPHCPVAADAYSTQGFYLTMTAAIAAGWLVDWQVGLVVLVVALLLYRLVLRRLVVARMQRFAATQLFGSLDLWRAMWRLGGVALEAGDVRCVAPAGDWRGFAASMQKDRI